MKLCTNGDEGYALATTQSNDAILLDIMLPGQDGLSILRSDGDLTQFTVELPTLS